jgi:citrate/tricarballylate utilization protein
MRLTDELVSEAGRQLIVCNACRYCEGFCPVFPALEIRREFHSTDVLYLSNLCHDCRACYHACMYAPPHEFAINLPRILAESRRDSYRALTWPHRLGRTFSNWKVGALLPLLVAVVVLGTTVPSLLSRHLLLTPQHGPGAFYRLISFRVMLLLFSGLSFLTTGILFAGAARFWGSSSGTLPSFKAFWQSGMDILSLRWLRGGGPGCYYPKSRPSSARRLFHALTFFGFLSATISTGLAGFYQHFLDRVAPYPMDSAPVVFGLAGGISMVIGTCGLIVMKLLSALEPADTKSLDMDYVFLVLISAASLTGILTLLLRDTPALGLILAVHLAAVAAFFSSLPYGKFVHAIYRTLALLRYRLEHTSN